MKGRKQPEATPVTRDTASDRAPSPSASSAVASGARSIAVAGNLDAATTGDNSPLSVTVFTPAPLPTALQALPAAPAILSGREAEVSKVMAALRPHTSPRQHPDLSQDRPTASVSSNVPPPVLVASIAGLAGVGKTALALTAGHAAMRAGWFTGSLFIDLHGYDESPVQPGQALEAFLRALGKRSDSIPVEVEQRAALYRSALAALAGQGHRLLIMADNASSADQARLLFPGRDEHRVLVTSRHTLPTLNARLIDLGVLAPPASATLVRHILQTADPTDPRLAETGPGIDGLASMCGHLPLALHISAALLILERHQTIAELTAELDAAQSRLSLLDDGEYAVRASFDLSYRRLAPEHASLFSLMALNPGPDMGIGAVAAVAERSEAAVRIVLRGLVQAHLLDCTNRRWSMHDLVREYAAEQAASTPGRAIGRAEGDGQEAAAEYVRRRRRLLEYYCATTSAASAHLTEQPSPSATGRFADQDSALAWLDEERANLTASVAAAAATQNHDIAIRFARVLYDYLVWRGLFDDLIAITTTAAGAAQQAGETAAEAGSWNNLGIALTEASRYDEAVRAYDRSIELFTSLGDRNEQGKALNGKGSALRDFGKSAEALPIHQDALTLQRAEGDLREQGAVLNSLALDHQELGNHAQALEAAEEAVHLFQTLGSTQEEASALCTMAFSLHALGRREEVQTVCQRAVEASQVMGNPLVEAATLLTCTELDDLTHQQQISYFLQALAACDQANAHELHAHALSRIAMALITSGNPTEAIAYLEQAEAMYENLGLAEKAVEVRALRPDV